MYNLINYKIKISVIIPTYNRIWILKKTIFSVIHQSYQNIEIIVIDDGSKDNTIKKIKKYGLKLKIFKQKNLGVSIARNIGIKISQSKFITFLDSDDQWFRNKILVQIKFFINNPNALICQTKEIWIKKGIKINSQKKHKKFSGVILKKIFKLCLISPSATMVKKKILKKKGLFNNFFLACEDYDLWLRIGTKIPIFLINKTMIIKNGGHLNQLSHIRKLDKFRIISIASNLKKKNISNGQYNIAKKILKKKSIIYSIGCFKRGNFTEALKYTNINEIVKYIKK